MKTIIYFLLTSFLLIIGCSSSEPNQSERGGLGKAVNEQTGSKHWKKIWEDKYGE